ncbi:MAG: hypothetical protein E6P95_00845 [Candidatus Moraniibacteriota bacterium]|nr:MAG: hypothetical protein E6P95_00845 [Candidatus Moranbacteria bacterium]
MLFHFKVFFFAVLFFVSLLIISERPVVPSWNFFLLTAGSLIALSVIAAHKLTDFWYTAYLPSTLALSVPLLLSLIDRGFETRVFIIAASVLYYGALLGIYRVRQNPEDKTARALLNVAALASLFFVFTAMYGLYLNYEVPLAILLGVYFFSSFMVTFQTLYGAAGSKKREVKLILLFAFSLGMIITELMWVVHFWPFGYLTIGVSMLINFFFLWRIAFDCIRDQFSWRQTIEESLALLVLLGLLVMTSPWNLVG